MLNCPICGELMCYDDRSFTRREMDWSRCMDCGFSSVFPLPSEEELISYYESGDYLEETDTAEDTRWSEGKHRARNWNNMVVEPCYSHLDFGSGIGSTLYEFKRLYPSITKSHGVDIAGGAEYRNLTEVKRMYDLVTSFQTLEHVLNPKLEIDRLKMKTAGILMIEVPVWGRVWPHIHNFTVKSFEKMGFESEMGRAAIYAYWRRE